ncbi:MAG: PASTA domain-containing protein [Flavobacteriales bacterium]|nr:PASTA domain-containing protein [Flavobacteriales bacterium]
MPVRRAVILMLVPLVSALLLLWGGWSWMAHYTRHDVSVRVPLLKELALTEAEEVLVGRGLLLEVIDSVYSDEAPKGSIVDQDPASGQDVKPGRKVYVVLNATSPKMLNMPALVDLSKRQALSVCEILGIKVAALEYRPDACVDCVVEQRYKGTPIAADERIRRGESITLVLGSGQSGERVPVPDVNGWTLTELAPLLNMASLNLGVVVECKGCNTKEDSAFARVYRQVPGAQRNEYIALGGMIDVWLTADTTGLRPVPFVHDTLDSREPDEDAIDP